MKASKLIVSLQSAIDRIGDMDVSVSVDLSTEDESTHGHRAYGDVIEWVPGGGRPPQEIVLIAECGTLNFGPKEPK